MPLGCFLFLLQADYFTVVFLDFVAPHVGPRFGPDRASTYLSGILEFEILNGGVSNS